VGGGSKLQKVGTNCSFTLEKRDGKPVEEGANSPQKEQHRNTVRRKTSIHGTKKDSYGGGEKDIATKVSESSRQTKKGKWLTTRENHAGKNTIKRENTARDGRQL